jgi:GntR family transcriptional regulator/MocR family aminotransferase
MDAAELHEHLAIDSDSEESVYQQIARQIEALISSRALTSGDRLPAIRTLAARLGLHRDTIALAYERLAIEGWAEARVGAGTFVSSFRRGAGRVMASAFRSSNGGAGRPRPS